MYNPDVDKILPVSYETERIELVNKIFRCFLYRGAFYFRGANVDLDVGGGFHMKSILEIRSSTQPMVPGENKSNAECGASFLVIPQLGGFITYVAERINSLVGVTDQDVIRNAIHDLYPK